MDQDDSAAEVVDMKDALEMVLKQEEDAIAVLGAGDEENCTYSMVRGNLFSKIEMFSFILSERRI